MTRNIKKILIKTVPYVLVGLIATNIGEAMRLSTGKDASEKMLSFFSDGLGEAFINMMPSFHPFDLFMGIVIGGLLWLIVYLKGKNAKKYRHGWNTVPQGGAAKRTSSLTLILTLQIT